jgi:SAM-dependent methyltransferase
MAFFRWLLRRRKSTPFDPWEKIVTAGTKQQVFDTRYYLKDSDYQLPKDEEEDVRLNFQHHALFHALGNHFVAPISPPLPMILDMGTGTGVWAAEIARMFPASVVVGIDLSATSFKEPVPENCLLRIGNVLIGLPFPDAFFSYVHQRLLVAGITAENWPRAIHELVRVTRPNGWLELVEIDNQMQNAGPATAKVQAFMEAVGKSLGFDGEVIRHLGDLLIQEGLHHVEMQPIPIPVGEWAGRVGGMLKRDLLAATNALKGRYCQQAGIDSTEFEQMVNAMAAEWEIWHPSCTFYAAYGKRGRA